MRKPELLHGHSVMEILQMLDSWALHSREDDVRDLWAVLSALRGPDNGDTVLKSQTTAWVRAAAVPDLAKSAGAVVSEYWGQPSAVSLKQLEKLQKRAEALENEKPEPSLHFIRHAQRAFEALIQETVFQEARDKAAEAAAAADEAGGA